MFHLPGYQISAKIYESANSIVYRGHQEQTGRPVILKLLQGDYPTPEAIARYKLEYEITSNLPLSGVIKAYGLENYKNSLVMILEDLGGESLDYWLTSNFFSVANFLPIAIQLTDTLGKVHQQHIIHKDINPANIVFNPTNGKAKLIDFGIATVLSRESYTLRNPNVLEGTLAYISPEQTGRMNRAIDYRTDFYSLGVTFYELLTGELPFPTLDAMELVHCHIAKRPIPPHELNPEIPQAISSIILKLLAKTAEERYQSAWGIKADLEICLSQLQTLGKIPNFPLGCQDFSDKFQIPQKLYGREQELEILLATFERVSQGKSEMLLVAGYSGIGKSALVQEVYKPITRQRGYFISGKFEQLQRNIPYIAIIKAFQNLIKQLLAESKIQLEQWRDKLLAAFGVNGQVIVDVIPEVELIIGKQPEVPQLSPLETQNRFNLVFQDFIQVFAKPEHPLVIFLDDLQWADAASLDLIQRLITVLNSQYLCLIGAYRDNEVSATHPLMLTIDEIKKAGVTINQISLLPLNLSHVTQLISDTLYTTIDQSKSLAELVLVKTQGNPFFVNEFLKSLYDEHLLEFDSNQVKWQWNIQQIQERDITDNVVDLMTIKIQKLPIKTQNLLQLSACVGNQFDLQTLAVAADKLPGETAVELREALVEGLVLPLNEVYKLVELDIPELVDELTVEYKFVHDRIQQAAYSLIPERERQNIHWQLGQLLLMKTPIEKREQKIFDIVNQLNFGIELISLQSQRYELAQLNLIAGKKAKMSAAYKSALNYFKVGIELLGEESWNTVYDLTLALYEEAAESAYSSTEFEQMEQLASVVLQHAKTVLDKTKVYEVKIKAFIGQNKFLEAIQIALEILNLLGVKLPEKPNQLHIILGLLQTKITLAGKGIEDLINLPPMVDPNKQAAMRIISRLVAPAYFSAPNLMPLLILKMVNLSIQYGNASVSATAYATYGIILCGVVLDIDSGYRFGKLALSLLERLNAKERKAQVLQVINGFINHWKEPVRGTLQPLVAAYQAALETGDIEMAANTASMYSLNAYFMGYELVELEQKMKVYSEAIRQFKQEATLDFNEIYRQAALNLIGRSENPCQLMGEAYNEEIKLPLHIQTNNRSAICLFNLQKSILNYLFNNFTAAVTHAVTAAQYLDAVAGSLNTSFFYFYDSLAHLAMYSEVSKSEQKRILKRIVNNQKKVKLWADHAPSNYLHKYYLIEAERLRVLGKDMQAMDYYNRAINLARQHKYIQDEAIANELTAKFYLAKSNDKVAQFYLLDARYCYLKWGAAAKVKDLDNCYSKLLSVKQETTRSLSLSTKTSNESQTTKTTGSGNSEALDLTTVMKASQALSREIMLDKLLASLMKILIENAGAQKGFLILNTNNKLLLEASGTVEQDEVAVLHSIPIDSLATLPEAPLPTAIIYYVARTKESVVLNDASCEGTFTNSPYIKNYQPKSILCVPLINQGQLVSIVYLENNLTTGAFTPDRLEVIQLLSSQAAISIKNAQLYSEVHESESRLRQFLEAIPVGVSVLDANGKPYYANQKATELLGKGLLPGITLGQLADAYQLYIAGTNKKYPKERLPLWQAFQGESSTTDDLEIHHSDKVIPIESWGTPIFDEKGNITYAIAAFQDITERKRAEAERIKFTKKLFQLNESFSRFVPRQFLQFLDRESIEDIQLGDQVQKEMSVLFSDIRSFTTLSETMTPEDNFKFINAYLSRMEPIIIEYHGFIDKYIGDAIMALFSRSADDAVQAGIAMLEKLAEYNQHRIQYNYAPIQIGIGINAGTLMLGTVGGKNRMDTTVISDAVNLASRVESLTKNYNVPFLITQQTFKRLQNPNQYAIRVIDQVKVKGKLELVTIYEVFEGDLPEVRQRKLVKKATFEQALVLYNLQQFDEAEQGFQECIRYNSKDTVAQIYLERCHKHQYQKENSFDESQE